MAVKPAQRRVSRVPRNRVRRRFWLIRLAGGVTMLGATLVAILLAGRIAADEARSGIAQSAVETLNVQSAVLEGLLDKYRLLPPLLSRTREIAQILSPPGAPLVGPDIEAGRETVEIITGMSGALDVALIAPDGKVVVSSRDRLPNVEDAVTGALKAARQARLGRQSLVLADGQRAYLFASAVHRGGAVLGFVGILVGFESVEYTWSLSTNPIYVSDRSGTIFLTNRPEWRLLNVAEIRPDTGRDAYLLAGENVPHLDLRRDLPLLEWQVHVLADERPVGAARLYGQSLAALAGLVLALGTGFAVRRREQVALRERRDRAIALRLERIVRDRTKALSRTNDHLKAEVEERRNAEEKLRRTQAELVQAAKLAGLGQMAAALGHEYNQPIAAIRTYADNAGRFAERERFDMVTHNLTRIVAMTDRMAEMSKTLLAFARKPGTTLSAVALGPVLDEAMILVRPRLRKAGITLSIDPSLREVEVLGGKIRLSQVFVNLIGNAADAIGPDKGGTIAIVQAERNDGTIEFHVRDDGPGIPDDLQASIFEPFVTTKSSGEGIGIGLSIVGNILADFGGGIRLVSSGPSGTVFAIHLKTADTRSIAAE